MSLLMDARKKSQQAQPVREGGGAPQATGSGPGDPPETAATESARLAGQNLFAAKLPPASYRGINRNLLFVLGCTILLLAGGTGYVWHIDTSSSTRPLRPAGAPSAAQTPKPDPARATVEAAPQNAPVMGGVPEMAAPPAAGHPQKTPPATAGLPGGTDYRPAPAGGRPPQTRGERPASQPRENSLVSIGQQRAEPVDTLPGDAYLAYRSGRLDDAWQLYLEMLRKDARNPDALLGLAAIAQRRGEDLVAAQYFSRVLALDSRNAVANAGMSALAAGDDGAESRLKTLLREQGSSAALHFALGNIYAGQSRWSEAQQAYFNAYILEPGNAGFAFNLAVSLDQLGQAGLAAQHYRRALELDQPRGAGFDHAQVSRRLEDLARDGSAR